MMDLRRAPEPVDALAGWKTKPKEVLQCLLSLNDSQAFILIFGLSMITRCVLMFWQYSFEIQKTETINIAMSLATTGRFANPFLTAPTGATAHLAPAYPFLLSLFCRALGGGLGFGIAIRIIASVFVSLQYALLPFASRVFRLPRITGLASGIAAALLPRMYVETRGVHETSLASLASIGLVLCTVQLIHSTDVPPWRKVCCGLGWGIAYLINPVFLLVLIGLLATLVLTMDKGLVMSFSLVALCVSFVTICPWIMRNYLVMHGFFPIRDNFGLELSVSNNDQATAILEWNFESLSVRHPFVSRAEGLAMQEMGETAYYRSRLREALEWIDGHPRKFMLLTVDRMGYFWVSLASRHAFNNLFVILLTGLGTVGLICLWMENRPVAYLFVALWVSYQIPYLFVQVSPRYHYPIDWSFWLLSAYAGWYSFSVLEPKQWRTCRQDASPGVTNIPLVLIRRN